MDEIQHISTKAVTVLVHYIEIWCENTFVQPAEKEIRDLTIALAIQ